MRRIVGLFVVVVLATTVTVLADTCEYCGEHQTTSHSNAEEMGMTKDLYLSTLSDANALRTSADVCRVNCWAAGASQEQLDVGIAYLDDGDTFRTSAAISYAGFLPHHNTCQYENEAGDTSCSQGYHGNAVLHYDHAHDEWDDHLIAGTTACTKICQAYEQYDYADIYFAQLLQELQMGG